jgi:hypothetical protein
MRCKGPDQTPNRPRCVYILYYLSVLSHGSRTCTLDRSCSPRLGARRCSPRLAVKGRQRTVVSKVLCMLTRLENCRAEDLYVTWNAHSRHLCRLCCFRSLCLLVARTVCICVPGVDRCNGLGQGSRHDLMWEDDLVCAKCFA